MSQTLVINHEFDGNTGGWTEYKSFQDYEILESGVLCVTENSPGESVYYSPHYWKRVFTYNNE